MNGSGSKTRRAAESAKAPAKRRGFNWGLLRPVLMHLCVILSAMYLVFYVIDRINPAMEFINNDLTKALLLILALSSVAVSEINLYRERKAKYRRQRMNVQQNSTRKRS